MANRWMKRLVATSATLLIGLAACRLPTPISPITPASPTTLPTPSTPGSLPTIALTPTPQTLLLPTSTPDPRPHLASPVWFKDAVIYEIFPRSFYDADGNGIGDLAGISQKLDHVQSLGANTLWLTPHYPSNTYHGYAVADYLSVNPDFGTLNDFKQLVAELHKRDMHLIVDFVANHASNTHPYFKDALGNPASRYADWFHFTNDAHTEYKSFYGVQELPQWNHDNPAVNDSLINAGLFWLGLGADGLRCDYAIGVPRDFWTQLRTAVKAKHPNAVLLGEVWDPAPNKLRQYFNAGFDALFDFPWYLALSSAANGLGKGVLNGAASVSDLQGIYKLMQLYYPNGAQLVRFASNHDTNRIASAALGDASKVRLAAALTLLTPGTPMIYYGEEIGMPGIKGTGPAYDEFLREPMDWAASGEGVGMPTWFRPADRFNKANDGISVEEEDKSAGSLLNFYRQLGQLRAAHPALRSNTFTVMDAVKGCATCLGIWRWSVGADGTGGELIALVFNFGNEAATIDLSDQTIAPVTVATAQSLLEPDSPAALHIQPHGVLALRWPT